MSGEQLKEISERSVVTVQMGLLLALVAGVWTLAWRVHAWETRLDNIERGITARWTWTMEEASWAEAERKNKDFVAPDVEAIRRRYQPGS